jgi:hypothetical protein
MALPLANIRARRGYTWKLMLVWPLFGISLTGCNDTCFIFTSNPPTGTINIKAGDPKPTCMLTKANGAVRVLTRTASTCESCPPSARIAHLFVSLRGIEVHPSANADDASPDWQELMQHLPDQPPRFDFINVANRGAPLPLGEVAIIPADAYRISPDSDSNLVIEINIAWTLSSSVGEGRGLLPVLSGTASVEREPPERMEERIGLSAR